MKQHLLLIGQQASSWNSTEQFGRVLGEQWDITASPNRAHAATLLLQQPFQAVVADFELPDGTGLQFLDDLSSSHPTTHRFLLAQLDDRQTAMKCIGTAHTFLASPCRPATVISALERAAQIDAWLGNDTVRQLLTRVKTVISPPATYFKIVQELRSANATCEGVGKVIAEDPAISSKLLQLVNSAVYGMKRQVASPSEAVMFLGIETVKSLVLLAHSYSHFDQLTATGFSVESLWRHSLVTGRYARLIAELEFAESVIADQAFTAGLIHDLGKLLLASYQPEVYQQLQTTARQRTLSLWEAEQVLFGATHAEVGAAIAAAWGLPLPVIEALALHHHPSRFMSQSFCPLTAVHAANIIEHEQQSARTGTTPPVPDMAYLGSLHLERRWSDWRVACRKASTA